MPSGWSGDSDRLLRQLPALFRPADLYDLLDTLRISRCYMQGIWALWYKEGRIIHTDRLIGKSKRWRYWTRSYCAIRVTAQNAPWLKLLARHPPGPKLLGKVSPCAS